MQELAAAHRRDGETKDRIIDALRGTLADHAAQHAPLTALVSTLTAEASQRDQAAADASAKAAAEQRRLGVVVEELQRAVRQRDADRLAQAEQLASAQARATAQDRLLEEKLLLLARAQHALSTMPSQPDRAPAATMDAAPDSSSLALLCAELQALRDVHSAVLDERAQQVWVSDMRLSLIEPMQRETIGRLESRVAELTAATHAPHVDPVQPSAVEGRVRDLEAQLGAAHAELARAAGLNTDKDRLLAERDEAAIQATARTAFLQASADTLAANLSHAEDRAAAAHAQLAHVRTELSARAKECDDAAARAQALESQLLTLQHTSRELALRADTSSSDLRSQAGQAAALRDEMAALRSLTADQQQVLQRAQHENGRLQAV